MKDYSSLAKMGRDAATTPIAIYVNSIIDKYPKILGTIIERRIKTEAVEELRNNDNNEAIHELY